MTCLSRTGLNRCCAPLGKAAKRAGTVPSGVENPEMLASCLESNTIFVSFSLLFFLLLGCMEKSAPQNSTFLQQHPLFSHGAGSELDPSSPPPATVERNLQKSAGFCGSPHFRADSSNQILQLKKSVAPSNHLSPLPRLSSFPSHNQSTTKSTTPLASVPAWVGSRSENPKNLFVKSTVTLARL